MSGCCYSSENTSSHCNRHSVAWKKTISCQKGSNCTGKCKKTYSSLSATKTGRFNPLTNPNQQVRRGNFCSIMFLKHWYFDSNEGCVMQVILRYLRTARRNCLAWSRSCKKTAAMIENSCCSVYMAMVKFSQCKTRASPPAESSEKQ